ncbi:hypothetical protein SAMN05444166_8434 [Singulisphaera sp. GP187]|uniref:hypothetical protein n=1 Tax=Singulisphaera sp. GP187 TaxID=1882752 RepID=UPI00092C9D2C|nr:hypothetical protein [Singulisphaera sp. GP187]SIO67735.1 hypothetical protein SAMN05444166_8434 [Singulisphaera sp. GP187]
MTRTNSNVEFIHIDAICEKLDKIIPVRLCVVFHFAQTTAILTNVPNGLDSPSEAQQDEGERESDGVPDDGLQTDGERIKKLAIVDGSALLREVIAGVIFEDGVQKTNAA